MNLKIVVIVTGILLAIVIGVAVYGVHGYIEAEAQLARQNATATAIAHVTATARARQTAAAQATATREVEIIHAGQVAQALAQQAQATQQAQAMSSGATVVAQQTADAQATATAINAAAASFSQDCFLRVGYHDATIQVAPRGQDQVDSVCTRLTTAVPAQLTLSPVYPALNSSTGTWSVPYAYSLTRVCGVTWNLPNASALVHVWDDGQQDYGTQICTYLNHQHGVSQETPSSSLPQSSVGSLTIQALR